MNQYRIHKILVVALDNLGDVVMGTSVFRPLKYSFPDSYIGYWVKNYAAGLFEDHSLVDVVHASDPFWDDAPGQPPGRFSDFRRTMNEIREVRYDAALLLNTEWRRSLACWLMKIPVRIGYRQKHAQIFLSQVFDKEVGSHVVEENLTLVKQWTASPIHHEMCYPRLEVSESEKKWVNEWLVKHGWADQPVIVCHPFAGRDIRSWPLPRWLELIRTLIRLRPQFRFVFICHGSEGAKLVEPLQFLPQGSTLLLAGAPLFQVKALMSRAQLFIGGDSGPGHMAAALGRPVVSLFGPSNPLRFAPRGHGPIQILQHTPLDELPVPDVAGKIQNILEVVP